jgi:hypothetical protein
VRIRKAGGGLSETGPLQTVGRLGKRLAAPSLYMKGAPNTNLEGLKGGTRPIRVG